jgi:putative addiction module CopG family antidote
MRTTQSLSITLPHDMAQMVKDKVASGEYASESEVIRDGLRILSARDAVVEKWLQNEVVPTLHANQADPSRLLSADDARNQLDAHIQKATRGA